jgi:hypothetical protein
MLRVRFLTADRAGRLVLWALLGCGLPGIGRAEDCVEPLSVCQVAAPGALALVSAGQPAAVLVEAQADSAVRMAADGFAEDLRRVSGQAPRRLGEASQAKGPLVVVGVLGNSPLIDDLVRRHRIDVAGLSGRWEAFRQIVVEQPFDGVARALVVVGSDRRGAVYGLYDLSEKIGVSPWYWFADVPVPLQSQVFLAAGTRQDQPKVKYRGFFINDEDPSFGTWARLHFGGFNADMYAHVFELLLRLKGNYLWPAMWPPKAFNDDDPQNQVLADAMGVVMGTSHHEPMTRAHDEWHRHTEGGVTGGAWNYATNAQNLRTFWRGGIERMYSKQGGAYESVVTIGMRGDGDEAMGEGTAVPLLQAVVADQRRIIEDVSGKPAAQTPQVWALYKEVQDYYDHGMRVPDDVTLLFADDNWGQLRRLPTAQRDRAGGYGIYYHFDYVGGPRNYKWLNTVQIEKTWQQMDLAWAYGADRLWIVNVGDIKPMEFPLSFFMKQAWDPPAMTVPALARYPAEWARATFGADQAQAIGDLLTRYSQLAARRKPELIDADSFALGAAVAERLDGGEFGAMVAEWDALEAQMDAVGNTLPAAQQSTYVQLVAHPIRALANLYRLYYAVAWNRRLAARNDPRANAFADRAEQAFRRDGELTDAYHQLDGGRWNGMMAQTHIGYTNWQQPDRQVMPNVQRIASTPGAVPIVFAQAGDRVEPADRPASPYIAIEAPHYTRAMGGAGVDWQVIAHLGRTLGAVTALPQGRPATTKADGVRLEYDLVLPTAGDWPVHILLVPTLDVTGQGRLRLGVSLDDGPMRTLVDELEPAPNEASSQAKKDWNQAVEDNARVLRTVFAGVDAGPHVLKIWRLDDNVVLQKLVLGTPPTASYLGPPEWPGHLAKDEGKE